MQQRRLRLGDILDDYCPRERRITNHAVVAMIDEQVKQTRCTTCDAEHEYKEARTPTPRRRKDAAALADAAAPSRPVLADRDDEIVEESPDFPEIASTEPIEDAIAVAELAAGDDEAPVVSEDDGPVHRRLIRATLPRPEGQPPDWKEPEFTIRQPGRGGRDFDGNRNGNSPGSGQGQRSRHRRGVRAGGQGNSGGGHSRFGGPRQGNNSRQGGQGHGQGHGHGHGGQRQPGNRAGGNNRGSGRKRGR